MLGNGLFPDEDEKGSKLLISNVEQVRGFKSLSSLSSNKYYKKKMVEKLNAKVVLNVSSSQKRILESRAMSLGLKLVPYCRMILIQIASEEKKSRSELK